MLVEELRAHGFAVRVVRRDADHVDTLEATLGDQPVDVAAVRGEDRFGAVTRRNGCSGFPLFETDADGRQFGGHRGMVLGGQQRGTRLVVGKDAKAAHWCNLLSSSSQPSRNSKASRWRRASAMSRPQAYRPWPSIR